MEESASAEIQEEANALIINVNDNSGSQHQDKALTNDITRMIKSREPPVSRVVCRIYRVPHVIRIVNEEFYTPQVISIGPLHHGDERLEPMEELKVRYFKKFVEKVALNVEKLESTIKDMEEDIRGCYAEASKLSRDKYVKMILLDVSFIIVCFLKLIRCDEWDMENEDSLVASQRSIAIVSHDLWLLENQLPFFVIEELYNLAFPLTANYPSVKWLTFTFFAYFQKVSYVPNLKIMHFVDLLRTIFLLTRPPKKESSYLAVKHVHSASQLHEAGVKFKVSSSKCLFDIKFTNGVLEIPSFQLFRDRISLFLNIMALEQCFYLNDAYVTNYIHLLDFLIMTTEDVDLLVENGIINHVGDINVVTTWIKNLSSHLLGNMTSDYYTLCQDLNKFCERPWNKWRALLTRDYLDKSWKEYFGNPYRTMATIAAIILLVLTFIQTVRSFY